MIQLYNNNNQLQVVTNGVSEFYSFTDIKSISPYKYSSAPYSPVSDKHFVVINFINENRNSSLKLDFSLIDVPSFSDVNDVVNTLSSWMNTSITGDLDPQGRIAGLIRTSDNSRIENVYSASFANVGSADGTVAGVTLKPGEIVNYDASTLNNTFSKIFYDATDTEFLISTVS